jgi:hypothetical protein
VFPGLIRIVPLPAVRGFLLIGSALPSCGFDLSEPLLKRFPPEEYPSADSHGWEVWDASNFAIDNVAEMGARTSDEIGCFGQIQDLGDGWTFEIDGEFGLVKPLRKRCYRMRGRGRHTVLLVSSFLGVQATTQNW